MDIQTKLEELKAQYDFNNQQISELVDHQKRIEGAYAVLIELIQQNEPEKEEE